MKGVSTKFYSYCCCCCFVVVIVIVVLMSSKCASSRPVPPHYHAIASSSPDLRKLTPAGISRTEQKAPAAETIDTTYSARQLVGVQEIIGSKPPRCEHRCNGCSPCEATQVPTNHHVAIQFTNYEPEGWKCKCGKSFYTP